jgi:hypothetical protein
MFEVYPGGPASFGCARPRIRTGRGAGRLRANGDARFVVVRRVRTIDASSWSAEQVGAAHVDTGQAFALAHRLDEVVIDPAAPLH